MEGRKTRTRTPAEHPHHRTRQIPWLAVVQFHKEIVARAEQGFFSLNGGDDQADRWSSVAGFAPVDLTGPWQIAEQDIRSRPFRMTLEQGQHESLFLGGPCFLGWVRSQQNSWLPQWRPLLYREIAVRRDGNAFEITPQQGGWSLTPLLYGLLDRMEVSVGGSLDDFAATLIETAAGYLQEGDAPLDRRIFRALVSKIPGAESEFNKPLRGDTFRVQPTSWVLFAPTGSFSALTRYLMQDYERLESLLVADQSSIGGLALLEDQAAPAHPADGDILPVIPLNPSQRRAVQHILERRPLTVISGPPGTGKSQVVVSLLLNAWAQGKTVLFASNNNKAVDVVRERVERFESEFPIAVRAGAKQKQNIQEVLRRTLNMAAADDHAPGLRNDRAHFHHKRQKLTEERVALLEALESHLPQRIDESRKTALQAYGNYRTRLASLDEEDAQLRNEQTALGLGGESLDVIADALARTRNWLARVEHFRGLVDTDNQRRCELQREIAHRERLRDRSVAELGLAPEDAGDWRWLLSGPSVELIADWETRFRDLLEKPIEQTLEPVEWREGFSAWRSADQAEEWASQARTFAESVRRACAELSPKLSAIRRLSAAMDEARRTVLQAGLPEDIALPLEDLRAWTATFAELATREPKRLDFLPWSKRARLRRQLQHLERQLRPALPLDVLTRIGAFSDEGRLRLAPIVEACRRWLELRREWADARPLSDDVDGRFSELRSQAAALRLKAIPDEQDTEAWMPVSAQCDTTATVADRAAHAWRRRVEKEAAESALRAIAKEWGRLASGIPLREAWRRGQGQPFYDALRGLAEKPAPASLEAARAALYSGRLARLLELWRSASEHEEVAEQLRTELTAVPDAADRMRGWWAERPPQPLVLRTASQDDWPELGAAQSAVDQVADWYARRTVFIREARPSRLHQAEAELQWAVDKLEQAITVLPPGSDRSRAAAVFEQIRADPVTDWPVPDLNQAFAEFSPERLRGRIERIDAELERGAFEDAKAHWLKRLRQDDEAIRAVDALEKSLRQYRGQVPENQYEAFRTALRAVPVWITTAQASQAIPLQPELFDIVVIDEASQCTLTNLLPLVYRGKTLAVIGDDNQLPAIPTIQEAEEIALARKHDVEQYLPLIGHAANDVYKAATESLPRRRADVIVLEEHFRSHPQIIGFSNRHIYLQRLELKKDPSWGRRLPIGSGVHSVPVTGLAQRGDNGRSWLNHPEAEAVLGLIRKIKESDSRSLSVGVVTPFAAHKDYLRYRLDELRLTSEVLVDTANGFQGDERDVMLFSPVVAKGITPAASRWVETPPNLINVAITRAREALFVVADFDYCLQQQGILRQLALYCRDIQLLRDTSPAELELFSWMVVKGWEPKVHIRLGDIEVDFILQTSNGARLAIEVDGRQYHEKTPEMDKARDAYLVAQGYDVVRIPAREVLETPFEVVHQIESRLQ